MGQNLLYDRKQCVQVNGQFSKWSNVSSGIPQGSVLGPVLFVIYINVLPVLYMVLYAADTKMYKEKQLDSDTIVVQDDLFPLMTAGCYYLTQINV